jgi:hypothetical protein
VGQRAADRLRVGHGGAPDDLRQRGEAAALSTIAIMQYIAPTLIFLTAVFVFDEPFSGVKLAGLRADLGRAGDLFAAPVAGGSDRSWTGN